MGIEMNTGEFLLYQTEDGQTRIEVRLQDETLWLSQSDMAELFQTSKQNIGQHLKNIILDNELDEISVVKDYFTTAGDGKQYRTKHYRLEAIIAVGYRVRSHRGTQFRQWATDRLHEYIVKGFTLDDERLAEPGGMDYFDELLERIRAIRASEKRFYQKVRDIYALSYDYDPKYSASQEFFATVQNKMLYAATGMTAAEIIQQRADASLPNMGLTTWKGAGRGRVVARNDVTVAKNYMNRAELDTLELLVGQYLDFAEMQAKRRKVMTMQAWIDKLDGFLKLNEHEVLDHAGGISADLAKSLAHEQYEKFNSHRISIEAKQADEEIQQVIRHLTEGSEDE